MSYSSYPLGFNWFHHLPSPHPTYTVRLQMTYHIRQYNHQSNHPQIIEAFSNTIWHHFEQFPSFSTHYT